MAKQKIQIDKGIEMPEFKRGGGGSGSKYPWEEMEVGDSFYAYRSTPPGCPKEIRDKGLEFKSAPEGEGWRVWRVE